MRTLTVLVAFLVALVFSAPQAASAEKRCHWFVHKNVKHGHRHHHPNMSKREFRRLDHFHRAHHHHCHQIQTPKPPPQPADTTPPETLLSSVGNSQINGRTYGFRSDEEGCTFECRDSGKPDWYACTSPYGFHPWPGPGWFEVRATDKAGNTDPTPVHRDFVQE